MPLPLEILSIRRPLSKHYNGIVGRVTKRLGNKYAALGLGLDPSSLLCLSGQMRQVGVEGREAKGWDLGVSGSSLLCWSWEFGGTENTCAAMLGF